MQKRNLSLQLGLSLIAMFIMVTSVTFILTGEIRNNSLLLILGLLFLLLAFIQKYLQK